MLGDLHEYMRVGLIHFMAYPETAKGEGPVLDTLRRIAADDYFDVVEVTHIADDAVRAQAVKLLDTARMTVAYGAQPRLLSTGLNVNDTDEERRKQAVNLLKASIDEAYEMNAVGLAFLSGKYAEETKSEAFEALLESTRELCAYAQAKGDLLIVHEVFDFDVDKKSLIGPASLARRYAEAIRRDFDNFGLLVDLSHIPLLRESPEDAILPVKDYLVHAHIGNCVTDPALPGFGDLHPRFGFPGSANDVDELAAFLQLLLDIDYLNTETRPIVSFEVKPFGNEDPEMVIAGAKRTLNRAWAMVEAGLSSSEN